jgi:hypothetical protein
MSDDDDDGWDFLGDILDSLPPGAALIVLALVILGIIIYNLAT